MLRHKDREFVATQTKKPIGFPRSETKPRGDDFQQFVAHRVTMSIIDALEAVEVDTDHHQRSFFGRVFEFRFQKRAVGEACQKIMRGRVPHLSLAADQHPRSRLGNTDHEEAAGQENEADRQDQWQRAW